MMKTADEMFEKAGYDGKKDKLNKIIYYVDLPFWKPSIVFNKRNKTIKIDHDLHKEGLQAINKKIKELGWLNE